MILILAAIISFAFGVKFQIYFDLFKCGKKLKELEYLRSEYLKFFEDNDYYYK